MAATSVISARHLRWRVPKKTILNDLCFNINENEFVGLIGPNGAGKSSLLRCLYRKIIPTSGDLYFLGQPISNYSPNHLAKHIAVVLQEPPSQFDLTVADVITLGLTPHKSLFSFNNEEDRRRVEQAADTVDLLTKLESHFNQLSGGEKQRAMIARAMVQQPKVLLMDEPTNHLDVRHRLEVLSIARNLDITVLVSIHDLNLAAAYCDRFILMNEGSIVADGSFEKVLTQQHLETVFGVRATIDKHPFHGGPRITFDLNGDPNARLNQAPNCNAKDQYV